MKGRDMGSRYGHLAVASAAVVLLAVCPTFAVQTNFDNSAGTGVWNTPENWSTDVLPTNADQAVIPNGFTVSLTTPQVVGDLVVSWPADPVTPTPPGTATLNIGPGANLVVGNTIGIRVGRAAPTVGTSLAVINQTGGTVSIISGSNGLRLSQADGTTVSDSRYVISGGILRGGPVQEGVPPDANASLNIGTQANNFNRAEFHVLGSRATEIRFEDVSLRTAPPGAGTGMREAVLHYTIDDGGVTPIVAEDQFDIQDHDGAGNPAGNVMLEITLAGAPPEEDILLVSADRLTPTSGAATYVHFKGLPDGTPIVRAYLDYIYTWNIDYTDEGADDGDLESSIKLDFVSRVIIPEPGPLALLCVGALGIMRRRRGRNRHRAGAA